jgi:hypothetical protein
MSTAPRLLEVFFYGLFMDRALLESKGARPTDIRFAAVPNHALRLGARAAVVLAPGAVVHGLLMKLSHADLALVYSDPGVQAYQPEPVLALTRDGTQVAALCYNLEDPFSPDERDEEYARKLTALAERIGLPQDYVASIARA